MTVTKVYRSRIQELWLLGWPVAAFALFALLAAAQELPAGYARALVALPIAFSVPGALTVCAAFGARERPEGKVRAGYTILLSTLWSVFVSVTLYIMHITITAASTYWGLLGLCAGLAVLAEARLLAERRSINRRTVHFGAYKKRASGATGDSATGDKLSQYLPIAAVLAGVGLLVGGLYFYDHLPSPPTSTAYTQFSWSDTQGNIITVGRSGTKLAYQISNLQTAWSTYRLSAVWQGRSEQQPLATPLTVSVGPNETIKGVLFVPQPPTSCVYRIAVTLIEIDQIDPLTHQQPTWSINANVSKSGTRQRACLL